MQRCGGRSALEYDDFVAAFGYLIAVTLRTNPEFKNLVIGR